MRSYHLSKAAETDIFEILTWTATRFGDIARRGHEMLILTALRDVATAPERSGSQARPEIGIAIRSYHLRHSRNRAGNIGGMVSRPRHLILYRMARPDLLGIGRILHDGM